MWLLLAEDVAASGRDEDTADGVVAAAAVMWLLLALVWLQLTAANPVQP
jgi:hypothetical protein